ncbi:MAG: hypothetical protein GF308_15755 [Candidatus Heimdallarchaeota archaeon]|nr:hypothetical protein [Candidatus Heimdallarchaeota archaeon]
MKPICLCLLRKGAQGVDLIEIHPNVLPNVIINEIRNEIFGKDDETEKFITETIGEYGLLSFKFTIFNEQNFPEIISLTFIYPSQKFKSKAAERFVPILISKLAEKSILKLDILQQILPQLYRGFRENKLTIKISSVTEIAFNFIEEEKEQAPNNETKAIEAITNDIWKE